MQIPPLSQTSISSPKVALPMGHQSSGLISRLKADCPSQLRTLRAAMKDTPDRIIHQYTLQGLQKALNALPEKVSCENRILNMLESALSLNHPVTETDLLSFASRLNETIGEKKKFGVNLSPDEMGVVRICNAYIHLLATCLQLHRISKKNPSPWLPDTSEHKLDLKTQPMPRRGLSIIFLNTGIRRRGNGKGST